jgi:hypothetical protein
MGRLHPSRYILRGVRRRRDVRSRIPRRGCPKDLSHLTFPCQYKRRAAAASSTLSNGIQNPAVYSDKSYALGDTYYQPETITALGDELGLLHTPPVIARSALARFTGWNWKGSRFVAPA